MLVVKVDVAEDDVTYLERLGHVLLAGGEPARAMREKIEAVLDDEPEGDPDKEAED
jgi:hypothetical protein